MLKHVIHLNKKCMDCGKDFVAIIEKDSRKTLNCWYWGDIKLNMKYEYFLTLNLENWVNEDNKPMWQRWLREYLPAYHYPEENPTVKPIYKRWILLLRSWLDRTPEEEMWTCPDCKENNHDGG